MLPDAIAENAQNRSGPEGFAVYHNNEGKRKAAEAFFNYIMSLEKPETIRIFTDEGDSWILESQRYAQQLSDDIKLFTQRGFCVERVQPPVRNLEGTFRDIERWLPAYTAGTLKMYYYPWARDELHRRTILLLPGHIAVYSMSLYGQRESIMTIVSTEAEIVNSFNSYFESIIERCRTMINVYTLDESDKIFDCIQRMSRVHDSGLYKSFRLSVHTLPTDVILSTIQRGSPYVRQLMECYGQTERFKREVLEKNVITDIICLPRLEDVMANKEPIPGTAAGSNTLYYTPTEYLHHLNRIIWYMKTYPNYRVALLNENELENVIIYTKGNDNALLVKKAFPFTMFEITDNSLSAAITGYLRRIADERICSGSREDTMRRLRNEAARVESLIRRNSDENC